MRTRVLRMVIVAGVTLTAWTGLPHDPGAARADGLCQARLVFLYPHSDLDSISKEILASAGADGVYTVETDAGAVRFGDGEHGRALPSGPAVEDPESPALFRYTLELDAQLLVQLIQASPSDSVAAVPIIVC